MGLEKEIVIWQDLAKCQGMDTNLFYEGCEENKAVYENLKLLCYYCPVKLNCQKEAEKNMESGFWAGNYYFKGKVKYDLHR
jgi:hypothetical protein